MLKSKVSGATIPIVAMAKYLFLVTDNYERRVLVRP